MACRRRRRAGRSVSQGWLTYGELQRSAEGGPDFAGTATLHTAGGGGARSNFCNVAVLDIELMPCSVEAELASKAIAVESRDWAGQYVPGAPPWL